MNRSALFVILAITLTLSQETSLQAFLRPSQASGPSAGGLRIGIAAATGIVLSAQTAVPVHAGAVEHIKVHGKSLEGIVMPDAYTLHQGSMSSNSVTIGDWESYIAQDLV